MADLAQKDRFVEALTELGGFAGHVRLRETLQWDEATYNAVKEDLLAEGIVTPGRGRGGYVSLSNLAEAETEEAAPVAIVLFALAGTAVLDQYEAGGTMRPIMAITAIGIIALIHGT